MSHKLTNTYVFVLRMVPLAGLNLLLAMQPTQAAVFDYSQSVNLAIPDDNSSGLIRQISVSDSGTVNQVVVALNVSAVAGQSAFVGDLYVYLQHDDQISVLLNRPGRRTGESLGYDDSQNLAITFSDAMTEDVHNYRMVLSGNESTPLSGTLTGTWKPDGRTSDPASVMASDTPSALLASFNGVSSEGVWRLFVADLSGGAAHQLDSWTLTLDITPVPEPQPWMGFMGLVLLSWAGLHRWKTRLHS